MIGSLHTCLDDLASLMDIEQTSDFASFMATQLPQAFTQMVSSEDDAIQLLQGVWNAAHTTGPPKPPWELLPGIFPAPDSTTRRITDGG